MEERENITYDELVQTRNIQILKSIVPFLEFRTQKPIAMLIQYLELKNAADAFSHQEKSMAACALPDGADRRGAMLSAIRQYCTPKEQETIDTLLNFICVMENYETIAN